jgi:hypothetical protein
VGLTQCENHEEVQQSSEEARERILAALCLAAVPYLDISDTKLYGQDSTEDCDFCDGKIVPFRRGGQHRVGWETERHVAGPYALGGCEFSFIDFVQ